MGKEMVCPQMKFRVCDSGNKPISKTYVVKMANSLPFKTLSYSDKRDFEKGPIFFKKESPVIRTQEDILRQHAYPCRREEPSNFWGL